MVKKRRSSSRVSLSELKGRLELVKLEKEGGDKKFIAERKKELSLEAKEKALERRIKEKSISGRIDKKLDEPVKSRGFVPSGIKRAIARRKLDPTKAVLQGFGQHNQLVREVEPRQFEGERSDQFQEEFKKEMRFFDKSSVL